MAKNKSLFWDIIDPNNVVRTLKVTVVDIFTIGILVVLWTAVDIVGVFLQILAFLVSVSYLFVRGYLLNKLWGWK